MEPLYELIKQIDQAETVNELNILHRELAYRLRNVIERDVIASLSHALSDVHDALVKKAVMLAEEETVQAAVGIPPEKWCWYVMGSMGRGEPTVWTDQDNGILFECPPEQEEECYTFIRHLAKVGTSFLHDIGYPYCTGNVMATNRRWSQSVRAWEQQMATYIDHHFPDDIRFLLIAMDMRRFYGVGGLVKDCKTSLIEQMSRHPLLLKRIGEHVIFPRVPLGWFGNFYIERWGRYSGCLHLKHSGYVQLVNSLKFLSCVGNISAMTTWERLEEISDQSLLPVSIAENVHEAFLTCVYFRLKYSLESADRDYVPLHVLDSHERARLKKAMKTAQTLQRVVMRQVRGWRDE